ncbi:1546_t:CDS:2, partial [Ambispora leptoticha]
KSKKKETQGTRCINETLDERLNIKKPSDKLVSSSKDHGGASKKTTNRQFKNQIGNIDNKENEEDGSETEEVNEAKRLATEEPTRMNIILRIRQEDGASIKKKEPSTNITKYNIEESIPVEECEEMDYVKTIKTPIQSTNANDNGINEDKLEIPDLTEFDSNLDPKKMWRLKSGTVVEKVIYEYARNLTYESCLHSFMMLTVLI